MHELLVAGAFIAMILIPCIASAAGSSTEEAL
jgi:hypothetical protein